ncbi:hypothetical protein BD408DRAFT_237289 [Parasitella parasitica]|nr:hypothetical protein BD408DRAFT_237289 [Parasitella parasitica]
MKPELKSTLERLGVLNKLEELGLDSADDILSKSSADLQKLLRINHIQAFVIFRAASRDVYDWKERVKTGDELLNQGASMLTTGDHVIDSVLNGGISLGMITEILFWKDAISSTAVVNSPKTQIKRWSGRSSRICAFRRSISFSPT